MTISKFVDQGHTVISLESVRNVEDVKKPKRNSVSWSGGKDGTREVNELTQQRKGVVSNKV